MNYLCDLEDCCDLSQPCCYSSCLRNSFISFEWEQCRPLGRARSSVSGSTYCWQTMNRCSSCCCSPCCCPTSCNMWGGSTCCRRLAPIRPRTPKSKKSNEVCLKKSGRAIQVIKPPKSGVSRRCLCSCKPPPDLDPPCLCDDTTPHDSRSTVRESSGISQMRSISAENYALMALGSSKERPHESKSAVRETPVQMRSASVGNYGAFSLGLSKVEKNQMRRMDSQHLPAKGMCQDPCSSGLASSEHLVNPMMMNSQGTATQTESGFIPIPIKSLSGHIPPQMMNPRVIPMMGMMPGAASGMPMGIPFMCLPSTGGWPMPMACNCIMGRQGPVATASPIPGPFPGTNFGLPAMGFPHGPMMGAAGMNWMSASKGALAAMNEFGKAEKPPQEIEELYQYHAGRESGSSGAGPLTTSGGRRGGGRGSRRGGGASSCVRRSTAPGSRLRQQPACRSSCTGIRCPGSGACLAAGKRSGRAGRGTRPVVEREFRAPSGTASSVGSTRPSGTRVERSRTSSKNRVNMNTSAEPLQFKERDSRDTMSGATSASPLPPPPHLAHAIALPAAAMMGLGMGPAGINPCWRPVPSMPCCIVHDSIAKRIFETLVHDSRECDDASERDKERLHQEGSGPRSASADRVNGGHWMHRHRSPNSLLTKGHQYPMRQSNSHQSQKNSRSHKSLEAEDFPHHDVDFPVSQKATCCLFNAATQTLANTVIPIPIGSGRRRSYAVSQSSSASREHTAHRAMEYSEGRSLSETRTRNGKFSAGRSKRSASHGSRNHLKVRDERSRSSSYGGKFNCPRSRSKSSSKDRKPQKQVCEFKTPGDSCLDRIAKQDNNRGSQPPPVSASGGGGGGGGGGRDAESAPRGNFKQRSNSRHAESAGDVRTRLSRRAYRSITRAMVPNDSPERMTTEGYHVERLLRETPHGGDQGDRATSQDSSKSKSHSNKKEVVGGKIIPAFRPDSNDKVHDYVRKPPATCLNTESLAPHVYKCAPISTSATTSVSETLLAPQFNVLPPQQKICVEYKYTPAASNETFPAPHAIRNAPLTYVKHCISPKQDSPQLMFAGPNEMVLEYDLSEYANQNFPNPHAKSPQGNADGSRQFIVNPPHKISVEYRYSASADKSSVRAITYVPEDARLKKGSTDDVTLSIEDQTRIPSLPSLDQPRRRPKEERQRRGRVREKGSSEGMGTPPAGEEEKRKEKVKEEVEEEEAKKMKKKRRSRSRTRSKSKDSRSESKTSVVAGESFRSGVDLSSSQRSYPSHTANPPQTSPVTSDIPQKVPVPSPLLSQTDAPEESGMTTELTSNATALTSPTHHKSSSHRRTLLSFRRRSACKQGRMSISPLAIILPKAPKQRNAGSKQKKANSPGSNNVSTTASGGAVSRRTQQKTNNIDSTGHHHRHHRVHSPSSPSQPQASRKSGAGLQTLTEQPPKANQQLVIKLTNDSLTSQTTDQSQGNAENQTSGHQGDTESPSGVKKLSGTKKRMDSANGHSKDVPHQRSKHRHHHKSDHQDVKVEQPPPKADPPPPEKPQQQCEMQRLILNQVENMKHPETQHQQLYQQQTLPVQSFPQVPVFSMTPLHNQPTHAYQPPQQQQQQQNQNYQPIQTQPSVPQTHISLQQTQPQLQQPQQNHSMPQSQVQQITQMFQQPQIHPLPQNQQQPPTYQRPSTQQQQQQQPTMYQQHPIFTPPPTNPPPQIQQQPQLFQQQRDIVYPQQTQVHPIPQQGFPQTSGFQTQIAVFPHQEANSPVTKNASRTQQPAPHVDANQMEQMRWRSAASKMRPPQPVSLPDLSESKGRTRSESRGPVSDLSLDGRSQTGTRSRSMVNGKFDGNNSTQVGSRGNAQQLESKSFQSQKGDFGRPSSQTQQMSKLQRAVQYAATIPRPILKPQRRKRKMGTVLSPRGSNALKSVDESGENMQEEETEKVSQAVNKGLPHSYTQHNLSSVPSRTQASALMAPQSLPNYFPFPTPTPSISQQASSINFSTTSSRQFSSGYASQTNFQSGHVCQQSQGDLFTPNYQFSPRCPQSSQVQHDLSGIQGSSPFVSSPSGKTSHHQIDITVSVPKSSAHPEPILQAKHHSVSQQPDKPHYDYLLDPARNMFSKISEPKHGDTKLEFDFSPAGKVLHQNVQRVSPVTLHSSPPFGSPSKTSIAINIAKPSELSASQRNTEYAPIVFQLPRSREGSEEQKREGNPFAAVTGKFSSGYSSGKSGGNPPVPFPARTHHPFGHPGPFNHLRMGIRRQPTLDRISSVSTTAGNTPDDAKTANDVSEGELAMKEDGSVSKEMPDKEDDESRKVDSDIFGPHENVCLEGESSGKDIFASDQKLHLVTRSSRLYGGKSPSPDGTPPWSPRARRHMESRLPIPRRYLGSSSLASNEEATSCRSGTEHTEDEYHVSLREKATSVRFGSSSPASTLQSSRLSPQPSTTVGHSSPSPPPLFTRRPTAAAAPPPPPSPLVAAARRQRTAQQRTLSVSVTSVEGDADDHPRRRTRTESVKKVDALQRSQIARQWPSKTRPPNYHPVLQPNEERSGVRRWPHQQQQQSSPSPSSPTRQQTVTASSHLSSDVVFARSRFARTEAAAAAAASGAVASAAATKTKHAPGIQTVHRSDDVATAPSAHPRLRSVGPFRPANAGNNTGQQQQHPPKRSPPVLPSPPPPPPPPSETNLNRATTATLKGKTCREAEAAHDAVTRCKDSVDKRTNHRIAKEKEGGGAAGEMKEVEARSSLSEMPEASVVTIVENPEERRNQSTKDGKGKHKEGEDAKMNGVFLAMRKSTKHCVALVTAPGVDGGCHKGDYPKEIIVMNEESSTTYPFVNTSRDDLKAVPAKRGESPENDRHSLATTKRSSPVLWRKNDFGSAVTNLKKSNSTFLPSSTVCTCLKEPVQSSKSILNDIVSRSRVSKPSESRGFESSDGLLSKKASNPCHVTTSKKMGQDGYPLVNSSRAYLEQQFQLLQRNQFYQQQILEQQHQVLQQFQTRPMQESGNEKMSGVKESLPEDHTLQAVTSLDDDEEDADSPPPPPPRRSDASSPGLAKTMRATRALRQAVKDMQLIQGRREKEVSKYSLVPRGAQSRIIEETKKSSEILHQHHRESSYRATLPHLACMPCCRCVSRTVFSWRSSQSQPHVQQHQQQQQQQHGLGCSSWHGAAAWWGGTANGSRPLLPTSSPNSSTSITHKSTSSTLPRVQSTVSHGRFCHSSAHLRSRSVHPTITEPSLPSASNRGDRWQHVRWRQHSPETRTPRHFCSCSAVPHLHDRHKETHNKAGDAGFGSWSRHRIAPCVQAVPMSLQPRASPKPPAATVASAPAARPHHHVVHQVPHRPGSVTAHDINGNTLAAKPSAKRIKLSESKVKCSTPSLLRLKLSEPKIGIFGAMAPLRAFETTRDGMLTTCGSHNWRRLSRKDRVLLLQRFHRLERSQQLRNINALQGSLNAQQGSRHKLEVPEVLDNSRFHPDDTVELRFDEYQRLMSMADDMARLDEKRGRLSATQLNTYFNTRPKPRTPPPTPASPKISPPTQGPLNFEILHEAAPKEEGGERKKGAASDGKSSRERKRAKKAKKKKKRTKSAATVTRSVCSKATSRSSYKRSRDRSLFFHNLDGSTSPTRNSVSPASAKSRRGARRRQRSNPDKSAKR